MMASTCNPPNLLNQKFSFWILVLLLTIQLFSVTETAAAIQFRGEIGGSVAIHCPHAKERPIEFLYFQMGDIYVNGFHTLKNVTTPKWENSRLDPNHKTTVHMYNLNASHSGDYKCHIKYQDVGTVNETDINLLVTANYTKPQVTMFCGNGLGCVVTCVSYNGFPGTEMIWNVQGSQMWEVVNGTQKTDNNTKMVNSSSTAHFNCSTGELRFIGCSVGDVTSELFSVCTPEDPPGTYPYNIIITIAILVLIVFLVISLLLWKYQKDKKGANSLNRRQDSRINGYEGEIIVLNPAT